LNTVYDLFVEAQRLKQQGLSPRQVADRVIAMGHGMGFAIINNRGSGGGGQPTVIQLTFPNEEVIYFDGSDWHHRPLGGGVSGSG
jgi:hypothetical protein